MPTTLDVPDTHVDLIEAANTAVLTTVGADGQPQSTAVWFLPDGGTLKCSITTDRQKYRNLLRNQRATLFVFDPTNPFRTLEVRAAADLAPDPDKALVPKFAQRYGIPVEMLDQPGAERVVVTLTPAKVIAHG